MFNSALNKTSNYNTNEKSAFFDFSRQGFSPLILKSKLSFYDQEIKESNFYQNDFFANKDFLRNSLLKEKLQINTLNKMNSPFNLNFMDRRNSLTNQGTLQQQKKILSSEKNFACFNSNLNLPPKICDKNYLFDSNLDRNRNSNHMFSNTLTSSNSNIFKTLKNKSNEKAKEIKYADDYSFKKSNNFMRKNIDLNEEKGTDEAEQAEDKEIKEGFSDKLNLRKSLRLNEKENELGFIPQVKKNSIVKKNKYLKKFKKLNKSKIKKQIKNKNNNNLNHKSNYEEKNSKINYAEKERKKSLFALPSNSKAACAKGEDSTKDNKNEIKGFSFLKQKRKTEISSSLFGCSSTNNKKMKINAEENENANNKSKLSKKILNNNNKKTAKEIESSYSNYSLESSDSEYTWSFEKTQAKQPNGTANNKKPNNNINKESLERIGKDKTKFKVVKDAKINPSRIKSEKKIQFSVSRSSKKAKENEIFSSAFSFKVDKKKEDKQQNLEFAKNEKNNLRDIIGFKDSIAGLPMKKNGFSMESFDEIFEKKISNSRKSRSKKVASIKNLISFVDSKTKSIMLPSNNKACSANNTSMKSSISANENPKADENDNSLDNLNRNLEYLYESFDDDESMKKFSSFGNNKIKDTMIEYIVWGKPNTKKLGFGDCPLDVYADFYLRGKQAHRSFAEKIADKDFLSDHHRGKNPKRDFQKFTIEQLTQYALSMKDISCKLSQYPIFELCLNFISKSDKSQKALLYPKPGKRIAPTNITEKVLLRQNKINNYFKKENNIDNNDNNNINKQSKKNLNYNLHSHSKINYATKSKKDASKDKDKANKISKEKEEEDSEFLLSEGDSEANIEKTEKNENETIEGYMCEICKQVFSNGQGLGGHMSRKHPNQSEKFKLKKETRDKRNAKREILYKSQRILLSRYTQNYDKLKEKIEGRRLIKQICKDHKQEYYQIKRELKANKRLLISRTASKK